MITGYRYGIDEKSNTWIIRLTAAKEEQAQHRIPGFENEFVSRDCTCEELTNLQTGEKAESLILTGVRRNPIKYTVGQKIGGGLTWYCHSQEELYKNYLKRTQSGKTYKPFILSDKMDFMITEVYGRTYEEVAHKMNTTPAKLREDVEALKAGLGTLEDEALYMPILRALQQMGKTDRRNGG